MDILGISQDPAATIPPHSLSGKGKLGLIFLGILLSCIVLEVGLRVASALEMRRAREAMKAGQTPVGEYWAIYDPDLGYRQNPKFGDMNPQGLRDHPISPKAGRFRVLFLGDSIAVYGDTVDDTFVGHLRAELHRNPAFQRVGIINAGIKGFTNYQELLYLRKYGLMFLPDLVGVEFCLNDLHKFLHSFRVENGQIVPGTYNFSTEAVNETHGWLVWLANQSHLLSWIKNNVPVAAKAAAWKAHGGFSFDYAVDISNAWRDEAWKDIESQLEEMAQLGRQHHFKAFVVVVPVASQYNSDYLARDREYVLKPQRKLREICERLGVPLYDLYPDMNASLFMKDGIHLTKEGRQLVGQRLALFLSRFQLIPISGSRGVMTP